MNTQIPRVSSVDSKGLFAKYLVIEKVLKYLHGFAEKEKNIGPYLQAYRFLFNYYSQQGINIYFYRKEEKVQIDNYGLI